MSDFLPQELVTHILTRVPAKSLMRFRCVSKSWKSLISSPHFVSMHTHEAFLSKPPTPAPRFLLRHYCKGQKVEIYSLHQNNETFDVEEEEIKISFPFRGLARFYFRIVGYCNGLLCLSDDLFGYSNLLMLWNPVIRRKLILPLPRAIFDNLGPYMFMLGFGYDAKNNDFKVVRVAYVQGDYEYNVPPIVEIFCLSTGNWKEISTNLPHNLVIEQFWAQAFVQGKVHWVAYKRSVGRISERENLIMAFDIAHEVFEDILLPKPLINESPINISAGVYEEKLAVFQYDKRFKTKICSIWVMEEYGVRKSWKKLFNIDVDGLGIIFGFKKECDIMLTLSNGEIVSYDPRTKETRNVGISGTKYSAFADAYTESLALLVEGEPVLTGQPNANEEEDDRDDDDVQKSEMWMQSIMIQFLTARLEL
ncbi:hypothetical protein M9H77_21262 [Catharanthus roseus]|uniref:Uncharacterized protein n=1 Tax=Catharanthus roseus TaxID=4058 RepID=A0ACC0AMY5_CATRO|nr:hypothetical protein M9H77_21262 [Catharanthus roseus]